jgi:hypothetical protein
MRPRIALTWPISTARSRLPNWKWGGRSNNPPRPDHYHATGCHATRPVAGETAPQSNCSPLHPLMELRFRFATKVRRCVRPTQVARIILVTSVDQTGAGNATSRIAFGVSDLRALQTADCAHRSRGSKRATLTPPTRGTAPGQGASGRKPWRSHRSVRGELLHTALTLGNYDQTLGRLSYVHQSILHPHFAGFSVQEDR